MQSEKAFESVLLKFSQTYLQENDHALTAVGITNWDISIRRPSKIEETYFSEFILILYSGSKIFDIIEFILFRNNHQEIEENEAIDYIKEAISEIIGCTKETHCISEEPTSL